MAGELNTEVHDDTASCRVAADWLAKVGQAVGQVGDAVYRQRGESESFWQGTAGNACRDALTTQGKDGDTLERLVAKTREALTAFADKIDGVRSRMDAARSSAQRGGLIVTPVAILPPTPAPALSPEPPNGPVPPAVQARHDAGPSASPAAVAEFEKQRKAFEEATAAVDQARSAQADAHVALDKAMEDPLATVKTLKLYGMFILGSGLSYLKTTQTTANDLFEKATKLDEGATTMQARAASMTGSPAMRELAEKAAAHGHGLAAETRAQYAQVQSMNSAVPPKVRSAIEANPGNRVTSGSAVGKVGKNVLRGLPLAGTGLTVVSGGVDVAMGKDPWNATGDTAASLGGSIAGGMAFGAGLGTVFPGPGNVVGGVIGGIAGGIVATGVVDMLQGDT